MDTFFEQIVAIKKSEIDKSYIILIVGDFSTLLLVTERSRRQKIIKDVKLN